MGYIKHHAIVLTSWKYEHLEMARAKAESLRLNPSELTIEAVNGYRSFIVPPDGSKEGWEGSMDGDCNRSAFKSWLNAQGDNLYVEWAEVCYGSDDQDASVSDHAWSPAQGGEGEPKAVPPSSANGTPTAPDPVGDAPKEQPTSTT